MSKEMVISANPHETRVAIMEEGLLCEYYVEREKEFALVGSIYKGRVTRVLPGMQSSFVDIGLDSDAFLYVTDFLEGLEDLDDHATEAAPVASAPRPAEAGAPPFDADAAPDRTALPSPGADDGEFPAVTHAAHDGPLSEAATAARYPAPPVSANPAHTSSGSAPSRGRFDNRNRPGRDFGTRGGRRGGRFNKRGGGRGGDQRYGRELPSSKYASPRSYDEQPGEVGSPEGHVSIILPGESLAKYKDKPPASDVAPVRPPDETMNAASAISAVARPAEQSSQPTSESDAVRSPEFRPEHRENTRAEYPKSSSSFASSSTGIEPLPGETLSKWKPREPAAEMSFDESPVVAQAESVAAPAESLIDEEIDEREDLREQEIHHAENWHEDQPTTELTEEEATVLAEHVAEAQDEEAAREVQDRVFAEADAAEAAQHAAERGELPAEEQAEDESEQSEHPLETSAELHELEEEEENAEGEGMIAPPVEPGNELEHHLAIEPEAIAAAADSEVPSGNVDSGSQQQQQPWKARVRDDFRARMQHPARRGGRDRGGRRDDRNRRPQRGPGGPGGHSHQRSQQVRRPQLIADMLKQGQEIIVQIAKEPLGKKGARITSHVALPGRFLVYMPTLDHTGVSRKIASAEERARLRHLVNDAKGTAGGGFIVRTAAGSAAPEEVRADVEFLTRTWSEIKARSEQRKAPSVLHRDLNLVERMLRDHMNSDYTAIWVDSEEEYTKVVDFMSRFQPTLVNRVKLYTKDTPVFEEFGIQQEIDKGLKPKVWLKSGGYIVINHTEALVAIDVNTGKFVGKGSNRLEDTIVRTNVEAVKEIVRQMRLRDLGGIIVIDFIDMEERRNREKVMAALEDALKADRAPSKVLRFNEFGLVAITRKRTKQALERTLCQPCPYCTGSGMVKSVATLCYEIQTEARKMAPEMDLGSITLRVHPEIAKALKTRESSLIEELERWTKKSVIIQADPTLHWEQYDIY